MCMEATSACADRQLQAPSKDYGLSTRDCPAVTLETGHDEDDNVTGSPIRLHRHPIAGKVDVEWNGARADFTDVRRKLARGLNGPARRRAAAGCRHDVPRGSESHPERRTAPSGTVRTVVTANRPR